MPAKPTLRLPQAKTSSLPSVILDNAASLRPKRPGPCSNQALNISRAVLTAIMLFFLGGCVTIYNPATQRNETLLIDTQNEVSLGKNMDQQLHKELKILDNPNMQQRVDKIGKKVAGVSDRQDIEYNFRILENKELNAFAVPGGFIYVNSGLMDSANDDELAGVLAHEIGHIAARHSVKKLQAILGYEIVMSLVLGNSNQQTTAKAIDIVFNLTSLGYSRKDEFLADKLAVKYTKKSGFNPQGIITFFKKLDQEAKKRGTNFNLIFLSSHPPVEKRIENAKEEIASLP